MPTYKQRASVSIKTSRFIGHCSWYAILGVGWEAPSNSFRLVSFCTPWDMHSVCQPPSMHCPSLAVCDLSAVR